MDAALRELDLVVERFPQDPLARDALLMAARLRWDRGDEAAAHRASDKLIADYPRAPHAAAAYVLQAEFAIAKANAPSELEEARATVRRVPLLFGRDVYPSLESRSEARVLAGEVSLLMEDYDDAAASFLEAIEDEPPSSRTARARLGLAMILLWQENWKAAAEILQRVVNAGMDPTNPEADAESATQARRRLTLIHRLYVRPAAGQPRWSSARQVTISGLALKRPTLVAASEDGRLMLGDVGVPVVATLSPELEVVNKRSERSETRPWFGYDQQIYYATQDAVLSPGGRHTFSLHGGEKPKPLAKLQTGGRGPFGRWFLVDKEIGGVTVFDRNDRNGQQLLTKDRSDPVDLAIDARGHLYVLDRKEKKVLRFGIDGGMRGGFSGNWRRPQALAVDPLGNCYVLDAATKSISVWRPDGLSLATFGPQLPGGVELRAPEDLAVDGRGRLFVVDSRLQSLIVVE